MSLTCEICPHHCRLQPEQLGYCGARIHDGQAIVAANYGRLTALALDPIEKKPLARFYPGSYILSAGSFGCNMRCPFCQNAEIAHTAAADWQLPLLEPRELVRRALELRERGNIGVAYTYNEPLCGYEFVRDCAELARREGLKNVLVSNGMICEQPWRELLGLLDAANIDLKAFDQRVYREFGGDLPTVLRNIELAAGRCHLELTTLVLAGVNDDERQFREQCRWIAGVDPRIPLHLSRFFPRHQWGDRPPTPVRRVHELARIAGEYLQYVYTGNC